MPILPSEACQAKSERADALQVDPIAAPRPIAATPRSLPCRVRHFEKKCTAAKHG
jgi:hypothetical protein